MKLVSIFFALLSGCTIATTTQPSKQIPHRGSLTPGSIQGAPAALDTKTAVVRVKKLIIDAAMATPSFITVTLQPNRRIINDDASGHNCHDVALPASADVIIDIERPIDGLVIRPLPSIVPIVIRVANSAEPDYSECVEAPLDNSGEMLKLDQFVATSEFHGEDGLEGSLSLSLGTAEVETSSTVTLMIYDASTTFSPLAVRPFGGDVPSFEQRWVAHQMPQVDISKIGTGTYAQLSHGADVFASMPRQTFVYAKFHFDDAIVAGGSSLHFPRKNEPLVLLHSFQQTAVVLAVDGNQYTIKNAKHLLLEPQGAMHVVSAPRELKMGATPFDLINKLPPSRLHLATEYRTELQEREKCKKRAWAPFQKRLPTIAWGRRVTYKNAKYVKIENAGRAAVIRKCGSKESIVQKDAKTTASFRVAIAQGRKELLKRATEVLK